MSIITIVGAGMMGSAMSYPACDNGHQVRLVGTHLDEEIIDHVKDNGIHPKLQRKLPECIKPYHIAELEEALKGADLVIGGVSSFGVDWFAEKVLPLIPDTLPVLSVTKGLLDQPDGQLLTFPETMRRKLGGSCSLSLNAIGGPCTSYELADRRHTSVVFCGDNPEILRKLKSMLETSYYHISLSTDVMGVECAVALKNAYALVVSLAVGLVEAQDGIGCTQAYNPQAALFGQSLREMKRIIKMAGAKEDNLVYGAGDLYVTIFGGRTRKLGTLLGRGLRFDCAMAELEGITLESVVITTRIARALRKRAQDRSISLSDFPLLMHIDDVINNNMPVAIPWKSIEFEDI